MGDSTKSPNLTLVCCIEHGRLESQTVLMIRSLRAFGMDFAQLPVIAVVGRLGAPLSAQTINELKRLGVELVYSPHRENPFPWFNYANKVVAVRLANAIAQTDTIAWIDSDILFARAPRALVLQEDEDFAARCDPLLASVESNKPNNRGYWQTLCKVTGANYKDLIWIDTESGTSKILYFNSGLFAWRRNTGFAVNYYDAFVNLLDSRIAQKDGSFFSADQIILNAVITRSKLRWRHMHYQDHHMVFPGLLDGKAATPCMSESAALHYSGSLSAPYRSVFLARLQRETPDLALWLNQQEQVLPSPIRALHIIVFAKWLKLWRALQWRIYAKRVTRCID